jgi:hypothetical protein
MKYILLIHGTEAREEYDSLSEAEQQAITAEYFAIAQEPNMIGGEQLQPPETATTVRVENGNALTTDGPFVETKEALGGFYMLEADNLDEALAVAARIPAARMGGAVEVRPIVERQG